MKSQATKGPWTASKLASGKELISNDDGIVVASEIPNTNDAQLIAQAPNLALKLESLIEWLGKDWDGDSMVEECKEALAQAGMKFEYDEDLM